MQLSYHAGCVSKQTLTISPQAAADGMSKMPEKGCLAGIAMPGLLCGMDNCLKLDAAAIIATMSRQGACALAARL